jgi:hypothetical protein
MITSLEKILLIDDQWVRESSGLRRVFGTALKNPSNPVLFPTLPWEERRIYIFGTVMQRGRGYLMWYQTCSEKLEGPDKAVVCIAESDDLVTWRKPRLNLEPFREEKSTNIVLKCSGPQPLYSPSIIRDESDLDPQRRYKMLFWDSRSTGGARGGCVAFSKDGLRWRRHGQAPLFEDPNDVLVAAHDFPEGFVCYQTLLRRDPGQDYPRDNLRGWRRVIGRRTSPDFIDWSEAETVLEPDRLDPPDTQFYGMAVTRIGSLQIGLLWTYHAESQTSDVQIAWSHNGRNWSRPKDRRPLIHLGRPGSFDSHLIFTASEPIIRNGTIHIFYGAFDGPHDSSTRAGAIGLATLREDGWCSLQADPEGGLTTHPLPISSRGLAFNLDASAGFCSAELLDENDRPLPGYGFQDCVPITGADDITLIPRWKAGTAPNLPPNAWSLRLRLRRAAIYSISGS